MPNTGKPSLGCHLCRSRRVKCDQTRPGCARCEKLGRPCPGYREEDDLLFRNENVVSYETNRTRDRRRTQADQALPGALESPSSSRERSTITKNVGIESTQFKIDEKPPGYLVGANAVFIPPFPQVQDPWKMYSINLLLNQYSVVLEGQRFYWGLDFLPDLFQETSEESCLVLATNAFTRAYIANQSQASSYTNELAQIYGNALAATNEALADPVRCVQDDTIMAVWLLANHEILVGSPNQKPIPGPHAWHVHTQGLATLLRLRGPNQFSTKRGRKIFSIMYSIIQTRCLIANVAFPEESKEWLEIIQANLHEYNEIFYAVSQYANKVSTLCIQIRHTINHGTAEYLSSIFPVLVAQADALEMDIPAMYYPNNSHLASSPGRIPRVNLHNLYRGAHSKLHHFLIYLFNHAEKFLLSEIDLQSLSQRREDSLFTLRSMAQEIVDSVTFALGDSVADLTGNTLFTPEPRCWADGMRLLWPLTIVSWSPFVYPHQRELAESGRERIGWEMGIRLALTTTFNQMGKMVLFEQQSVDSFTCGMSDR